MFTKEELESMKFRKLKSIAKQRKISRRLTTKREIIDSLLNFEEEECLDDITVDLLNNSEVEDNPAAMETETGKKGEPPNIGKTRSGRRFAKPRMTVFQMRDDDDESFNQSSKGRRFAKPRMTVFQMRDDDDESFNQSSKDAQDKEPCLDETFEIVEQQNDPINVADVRKSGSENKTGLRRSVRRTRSITSSVKRSNKVSTSRGRRFAKPRMTIFQMHDADDGSHNQSAKDENSQLDETFEIEEESGHKSEGKGETSSRQIRKSLWAQDNVHSLLHPSKISEPKDENSQLDETFEIEEESGHKSEGKGETSSRQIRKSLWAQDNVHSSLHPSKISEPKDENPQLDDTFEIEEESGHKSEGKGETSSRQIRKSLWMQDNVPSPQDSSKISVPKGSTKKNSRIPKFVKKIPDFQNIHKKQFEKMESLVDNQQRKLGRAKGLLSPVFRKNTVMVFTAQPRDNPTPLRKPLTEHQALGTVSNSRYGSQNVLKNFSAPSLSKNGRNNIHNKQNVKELITKKLPVHNKRENVRQESRTTLRGVRLNRRFELQMAHRKIN